jgi:NAD(P)-dependent dehydrogenase (short-subunit alcohol dehydrogenase family)
MEIDLRGKKFLVTGGSSGIGLAIARLAREAGAQVAIVARRAGPLEEAAASIDAVALPGDMRDPRDADAVVAACTAKLGGLTTLVNAAGVIGSGGTAETTPAEWDRIMSINLAGTVHLSRAALGPLTEAGPGASILNFSSVAGNRPYPGITAYCVSKAAVEMYTRCLALELAPAGVRVNAIAPGVVVTNLHTASNAVLDYQAFLERSRETHPLGFVGQPEDAAHMALYLCSDLARWVTGAIFPLDGGRACLSAR